MIGDGHEQAWQPAVGRTSVQASLWARQYPSLCACQETPLLLHAHPLSWTPCAPLAPFLAEDGFSAAAAAAAAAAAVAAAAAAAASASAFATSSGDGSAGGGGGGGGGGVSARYAHNVVPPSSVATRRGVPSAADTVTDVLPCGQEGDSVHQGHDVKPEQLAPQHCAPALSTSTHRQRALQVRTERISKTACSWHAPPLSCSHLLPPAQVSPHLADDGWRCAAC